MKSNFLLRKIATVAFRRKHNQYNLSKKSWNPLYDKDFSFLCFLMKMLLKGVVFFQKIRLYLIFLLRFRSTGNGKCLFLCLSA